MRFRALSVRSRLLVCCAVLLLSYITPFFAMDTAAAFSSTDDALIDQYNKLVQIQHVADCLYRPNVAPDTTLERTTTNNSIDSIRPYDFTYGAGNATCDSNMNTYVGALLNSTDPKGPSVVSFFEGLGFVISPSNSDKLTRVINGVTISEKAIQQKFLDLNNGGAYPNFSTPDMQRAALLAPLRACNLQSIGIVSSLDNTYQSRIDAAKSKTVYSDGKYYALVDEIDSSGAIVSTLYEMNLSTSVTTTGTVGGTAIAQCYSAIDAYSASNRAAVDAAQKTYIQQQIDAATAVLNATLCNKADYTTNGTFNQQGYNYCTSSVRDAYTRCSAADVSGVPTTDKIRSCMINSLPAMASKITPDLIQSAVNAAAGVQQPTVATTRISNDTAENVSQSKVTCAGGSLGWLTCPLADMFTSLIKNIAGYLNDLLKFKPLILGANSPNDPVYGLWKVMVGPANLLLVIGFLIVIFSQATSFGLSAYGIKKLLPRIIAAAILINLSYFICAIAIDISNILGGSVKSIVTAIPIPTGNGSARVGEWYEGLMATIGALGVGAGLAVVGAAAYIVPALLSAALAVLTAFVVIAARQVLITLFVIISPLAFAAFVLPNTENLFKKWREALTALLAMYPIIMLLFYGALLVSKVISVTATVQDTNLQVIQSIISLFVLVFPLFALPIIMKMTGGLLERFAGLVNNRSKGLIDRSRKFAQTSYNRGQFGQAMANRRTVLDDRARRNSIRRMEAGNGWSRLTGIGMGAEALRIRGTALADAKKTLDEREVSGHLSNLNKQASGILAGGGTKTGKIWTWTAPDGTAKTASEDDMDATTKASLDYAVQNRLMGSRNGSRAIAKSLIDTGEARLDHIDRLANAISDPGDKAAFVEHTRAAAQSAGLDQLKYMTVDSSGKVDFAGVTHTAGATPISATAAKQDVARRISNSKLSGLNKYTFDETDSVFVDTLGSNILKMESDTPDRLKTEMADMGADAVSKMAKLVFNSADGRAKFATELDAKTYYATLHNLARKEHHG